MTVASIIIKHPPGGLKPPGIPTCAVPHWSFTTRSHLYPESTERRGGGGVGFSQRPRLRFLREVIRQRGRRYRGSHGLHQQELPRPERRPDPAVADPPGLFTWSSDQDGNRIHRKRGYHQHRRGTT
jgi:hypothetical protein